LTMTQLQNICKIKTREVWECYHQPAHIMWVLYSKLRFYNTSRQHVTVQAVGQVVTSLQLMFFDPDTMRT
jgi:hypothetical protein